MTSIRNLQSQGLLADLRRKISLPADTARETRGELHADVDDVLASGQRRRYLAEALDLREQED